MKNLTQGLNDLFRNTPSAISRKNQQGYFFSFYGISMSLLLHFSLIFIFFKLQVYSLSAVNIGSTLLFLTAVYLLRYKGMMVTALLIASSEVLVHQAIAVHVLGWGYGFQYYYIIIPIYILSFHRKFILPIAAISITLVSFIALYYYARFQHIPLVRLDARVEELFFIFNISVLIVFIALCSLIYNRFAYFANQALEKEKVLADTSMRQTQQLLSIVSHDIANSNFVCSMALEMLGEANSPTPEERTVLLSRIEMGVRNIKDIINSVRTLRAIDDGKQQFQLQAVEINAILEKTRQTFLERLREKNVELAFSYPPGDALRVLAEPITLYNNVTCNLVSNAIKFSFPGSRIDIKVDRRDPFVSIAVSDSGIGIPPELLGNLFTFGKKTSRPGTAGEAGTGYGMPVVKKFVDLYRGAIEVSSIPHCEGALKHGTTFMISLLPA